MMKTAQAASRQSASRQSAHNAEASTLLRTARPGIRTDGKLARMQSAHGNQRLLRMLNHGVLQAKLTINQPEDAFEQEADRVADRVMRMPDAQQAQSGGASSSADGDDMPLSAQGAASLQRACACDGTCEDCQKKVEVLQRVSASSAAGGAEAPPIVHEVLQSSGQPLDHATRSFMEPRFGRDFSQVRIHADSVASQSASAVNALAYTVGHDIIFGPGRYSPTSTNGQRLLAHELTHTVQQAREGEFADPSFLQRTIGDGHDLASPRFKGDPDLEACFDGERVLKVGDRGPAVKKIQQALVDAGFPLPQFGADGVFKSETQGAVADFQRAHKLAPDGIVGPNTMASLDAAFGGAAPAASLAPPPSVPKLSATVTTPPAPGNCGTMNFVITWGLSANSRPLGGFIIQDITFIWNERDCAGVPVPDPGGRTSPLRYFEAWRVAPASQTITPVTTDTFSWVAGVATGCTSDRVTIRATARYHDNVATLPAHMTASNASTFAGTLQSSLTDPLVGGLISPAVAHNLTFHWNCCPCAANPTVVDSHTP